MSYDCHDELTVNQLDSCKQINRNMSLYILDSVRQTTFQDDKDKI